MAGVGLSDARQIKLPIKARQLNGQRPKTNHCAICSHTRWNRWQLGPHRVRNEIFVSLAALFDWRFVCADSYPHNGVDYLRLKSLNYERTGSKRTQKNRG